MTASGPEAPCKVLGFGLSIEPQLWALIFVMVRVGSALIAAPVFGAVQVPLPASSQ